MLFKYRQLRKKAIAVHIHVEPVRVGLDLTVGVGAGELHFGILTEKPGCDSLIERRLDGTSTTPIMFVCISEFEKCLLN